MKTEDIQNKLLKELAGLDCLLISYSGGVDSTLLSLFAQKSLKEKVKHVLFDASIVSRRAIDDAKEIASKFGFSCNIMPFPIMENQEFKKNSPNRCYVCKKQSAKMLRD